MKTPARMLYLCTGGNAMFHGQIPEQIRQLAESFDLSVFYLLFPSQKKIVLGTGNYLLLDALSKRKALLGFPLIKFNEPCDLLYCRGYYAGKVGLSLKNRAKIIIDLRGLISEEVKFQGDIFGRLKSAFYRRLERSFAQRADLLVVVSDAFKMYMQDRFGRKDVVSIKPFVNVERFAFDSAVRDSARRKLGFAEQDIVLVYCGGMGAWQKCPETIHLFKELNRRDPRVKMLFITRDRHAGFPSNGFTGLRLENKDVPKYLNAADFGLLLRDDLFLNRLAYPTKFSEYLLCGLPVIMTPHIGCRPDADESNSLFIDGVAPDAGLLLERMKAMKVDRQGISDRYRPKLSNRRLIEALLGLKPQ